LNELSLALVGDRRMSALHEEFMNVAGPTDVLTFPLDVDARGRALAGEVVVCVPEARRQSKLRNVPVERELLLYALHGLLHLCGYDDRTGADFRAMHRAEDQILTRLGVGPVFAPPDRPAPDRTASPRTRTSRRGRQAASGGGAH
jgi:probable rRNA maturation factor